MSDTSTTSTNSQSWKQKYSSNKPLRKAKETVYAGISVKWFYIAGFWSIVTIIIAFPLIFVQNWIIQSFIMAVAFVWLSIYFLHFRTCEKYDESMLTLKFMIAEYKGAHEVCKFDMDVSQLMTYIPVKRIHPNGLIEYTRGRFGIMIEYFPPTDPGDQMERHLLDVQAILNRLSGDMQLTLISSSRFGTKPAALKRLEQMLKDPNTSPKCAALIHSEFLKIKSGKPTPDWCFRMALGLGSHATVEDAAERLNTEIPGFLDGLYNAKIIATTITQETELVKSFIQFMVPRGF